MKNRAVGTFRLSVENGVYFGDRLKARWSSLLSFVRFVSNISRISATLHKLRQLVHFGPWRIIAIFLVRKMRPVVTPVQEWHKSLLGDIEVAAVAAELRRNSVAVVGMLPAKFVNRVREITDRLPFNEYQLVHQVDADICDLVNDPGVKSVLRAYLKCEPVLLEASLFVSKPEADSEERGQNSFHFDYAGWESLNVFVYLTDVTENSSYHEVIRGSHRDRGMLDVIAGALTVQQGQQRFGAAIQAIKGPAGTLFFENTEAFHRRHRGNERRVMLNLLYASHRSLLSHGRASRQQLEMRDREFEKLRAAG